MPKAKKKTTKPKTRKTTTKTAKAMTVEDAVEELEPKELKERDPAEQEMLVLVRRFNTRRNQMFLKWGEKYMVDSDHEIRERFEKAMHWFEIAQMARDVEWARECCDQLMRGYTALEGHLLGKGILPQPPDLWEFTLDNGMEIFFARTEADKERAPNGKPVFTADELLVLLEKMEVVIEAKRLWENAKVVASEPPFDDPVEDVGIGAEE